MISLEKIKQEKCQPSSPFKKTCTCIIIPPPLFSFQILPPPTPGKAFKIYLPHLERRGVGELCHLYEKLNFNHHIKEKTKVMKGIGVIKRLSKMVIYFMINQTIKLYVKKSRLFNTMPLRSLLVPTKLHLKLNFKMNQAQNLLSLDGSSGNGICFLKLKKLVYQNIYSIRYYKATICTTLRQVSMLQHFISEQMY